MQLPLLSVGVAVPMFFLAGPAALFLLFVYMHEDLERLAGKLGKERGSVWPLSELPFPERGQGQMLSLLTQFVVWGAWPLVSLFCAWRTLPLGNGWIAGWDALAAFGAIGVSLHYWAKVHGTFSSRWRVVTWFFGIAGVACFFVCGRASGSLRNLPVRFTDFRKAEVSSLDLSHRDLRGAFFDHANVEHANFCSADLHRATFLGAHARAAKFSCGSGCDLSTVDFGDADLTGTDFWRAALEHGDLSGATLDDINLNEAHADGARFRGTKGSRAGFFKARLSGAIFARADLHSANFTSAILVGADLSEAVLKEAHLLGADLSSANLCGTDLTGADVNEETHFDGAKFNRFTTLPASFDPKTHHMSWVP